MKLMIFDQNVKNGLHLDRQKAYDLELRENGEKSEGFLRMVSGKIKNETDATFLHVYDVFASTFRHFSKTGM